MPMGPLAIAVVAEGFKLSMSEALNLLKKKSSAFNVNVNIDNAYLKASNVEMVKTIWQIDKTVNLNDFYHPSKIKVEGKTIPVNSLSSFPEESKMVIQGIAGQGKSILLRYLAGTELKTGNRIPLFIELRKITAKKSIEDLVANAIGDLGIKIDPTNLEDIYSTRKFVLLFDAFDEIPSEQIMDTLSYIESICSRYHYLQIIITSRPEFDIQKSTFFNVSNLEIITVNDFRPLLSKFFKKIETDEVDEVDEIMKSIHANKSGVMNFLTTPLLLTLLVLTYRGNGRIPESPYEFYDDIFSLLVNRHDSTKAGFRRETRSNLSENELENLFCAFCFFCMQNSSGSLTRTLALDNVSKAKKYTNISNFCESDFLIDCVKNTCLIIKDGFDYHFIHKSIMEFHAAKFIAKSEVALKRKFYNAALDSDYYSKYTQEIVYLKEMDPYYYKKEFFIPLLDMLFEFFNYTGSNVSLEIQKIGQVKFGINHIKNVSKPRIESIEHVGIGLLNHPLFDIIDDVIFAMFDTDFSHIELSKEGYEGVVFKDSINCDEILSEISKVVEPRLASLYESYNVEKEEVREKECIIDLLSF